MSKYILSEDEVADTSSLAMIYSDGAFSDRGVNYFTDQNRSRFFIEATSRWQDEGSFLREVSKEEFIQALRAEKHDERVLDALAVFGITLPVIV